ncbi:p4b precursor [Pteropox virus]|uniref:Virion core protein 4b n=1 Tax=Pteropox virus TaxID=1873698 RepID=A0A1B1MRG6_9POXV|nr:p4b precursor [Pteropox virus]ANS71181.1 p4b precursor [Pteropox virus]
MDHDTLKSSDINLFLNTKIQLSSNYNNQHLSLVNEEHIHKAVQTDSCSVCNMLSSVTNYNIVSGGAPRQKPYKRQKQSQSQSDRELKRREDACKARNYQEENLETVPLDELTSTQEWVLKLRKDGDRIAAYIRNNKCNIESFTIQDMLMVMEKLNIARRDRSELFEIMAHVKSSLTNSNLSVKAGHPLMLIYSRSNAKLAQQIKEMEMVYEPSNYPTLIATSRFQSSHFIDMSSSSDLSFCYKSHDSTCFVSPILMALFGVKIAALENTFISGDTFMLIHQLYEYRKVQPENYMLLVSRLTEEHPIIISGIGDIISTEVQRANLHAMIRKIVMNMRMGVFHCKEDETIDNQLMKIIHTGCSTVMSDEEQTLASILSIVGFKPALVSVSRGMSSDLTLQSAPYVVVDPMRMITTSTSPISINTKNVCSLAYDGSSSRVMFVPPNVSYRSTGCSIETFPTLCGNNQGFMDRTPQSPIIVNGTLMFLVERRNAKSVIGECFTGFRSVINDAPIDVAQELHLNGIMYKLKSAVCYRTGDNFLDSCGSSNSEVFLTGHYTILFTELGPWMYDPMSILSKPSREARLMRAIKQLYKQEVNADDDSSIYDWMRNEGANIVARKKEQLMKNISVFEDDLLTIDEAMVMISRQCCLLVYAQDYAPYISSRTVGEGLWF